jgi:hypothetical protein
MSDDLGRRSDANSPRHRHPATLLWLTLLLVSYVFLVHDALSAPPPAGCSTTDHQPVLASFLRLVPPGEWTQVFSLFVLAATGAALLFFSRSWLDRFFGRRPELFYRFSLRLLLVSVACLAGVFALARQGIEYAAGAVVAFAVPIAVMGIAVWVSDREQAIRKNLESENPTQPEMRVD